MQQHILNSLFALEASIRGMAYQVTLAAHHRSVLSRINYDSYISLLRRFQIYIVVVRLSSYILALIKYEDNDTMSFIAF